MKENAHCRLTKKNVIRLWHLACSEYCLWKSYQSYLHFSPRNFLTIRYLKNQVKKKFFWLIIITANLFVQLTQELESFSRVRFQTPEPILVAILCNAKQVAQREASPLNQHWNTPAWPPGCNSSSSWVPRGEHSGLFVLWLVLGVPRNIPQRCLNH